MLAAKTLAWVNERRAFAELEPIADLEYVDGFDPDPIVHSIHPEARYTIGSGYRTIQYLGGGGVVQIDLPKHVLQFLREWREGKHPDY